MCELVSVTIFPTERGLEILAAGDLDSHAEIDRRYYLHPKARRYEVEWLEGNRLPTIRFPVLMSLGKKEAVFNWFLDNFPRRERLIMAAREIALRNIPDHLCGVRSNEDECLRIMSHNRFAPIEERVPVVQEGEIYDPKMYDEDLVKELFCRITPMKEEVEYGQNH